jgi:hypothetical protein
MEARSETVHTFLGQEVQTEVDVLNLLHSHLRILVVVRRNGFA